MKNLSKQLKKVRNKLLIKVFEYLYKKQLYNNFFRIIKILKRYSNMQYIWYCPRQSRQSIVLKTNEPILKLGRTYKCKRCKTDIKATDLILNNKRNLRKYIENIEKSK